MENEPVFANGINGLTGQYLFAPADVSDIAAIAKGPGGEVDPSEAALLASVAQNLNETTFGLPWNIDPTDPSQAGWAVVFAAGAEAVVLDAVEPLVEHRRRRLGHNAVKVLDYRPGERWADWLVRHRAAPGSVDPDKVPYYVLLVGSPAEIPFSFQYLMDVEYAVGRIHFDEIDAYARYVASVIAYEDSAMTPHDASAAFFGTRHRLDRATELSADRLVEPLARGDAVVGREPVADPWGYATHLGLGPDAAKSALEELLAGTGPAGRPALLFSATHGMGGWPAGHPDQSTHHGALLCQDWPGIGGVRRDHYFAAADVPAEARIHGLIAFLFACYGAGTPERDDFVHAPGAPPPAIADAPFLAALPKALLAHPDGGALAVIGHIERAWGYSFVSEAGSHLIPFENALGQILTGRPVGLAMKDFNEKFAALSANLSTGLRDISFGMHVPDVELARLWTERNDAQNYVVIGDPAVHLGFDM